VDFQATKPDVRVFERRVSAKTWSLCPRQGGCRSARGSNAETREHDLDELIGHPLRRRPAGAQEPRQLGADDNVRHELSVDVVAKPGAGGELLVDVGETAVVGGDPVERGGALAAPAATLDEVAGEQRQNRAEPLLGEDLASLLGDELDGLLTAGVLELIGGRLRIASSHLLVSNEVILRLHDALQRESARVVGLRRDAGGSAGAGRRDLRRQRC